MTLIDNYGKIAIAQVSKWAVQFSLPLPTALPEKYLPCTKRLQAPVKQLFSGGLLPAFELGDKAKRKPMLLLLLSGLLLLRYAVRQLCPLLK